MVNNPPQTCDQSAEYVSNVRFAPSYSFPWSGQIETDVFPSPSVEASSEWVYLETTSTLLINGTNFNKEYTKLHFDPPLPGDKFRQEVGGGEILTLDSSGTFVASNVSVGITD